MLPFICCDDLRYVPIIIPLRFAQDVPPPRERLTIPRRAVVIDTDAAVLPLPPAFGADVLSSTTTVYARPLSDIWMLMRNLHRTPDPKDQNAGSGSGTGSPIYGPTNRTLGRRMCHNPRWKKHLLRGLLINRHRPPAPQSESLGQGTQISARSMEL